MSIGDISNSECLLAWLPAHVLEFATTISGSNCIWWKWIGCFKYGSFDDLFEETNTKMSVEYSQTIFCLVFNVKKILLNENSIKGLILMLYFHYKGIWPLSKTSLPLMNFRNATSSHVSATWSSHINIIRGDTRIPMNT